MTPLLILGSHWRTRAESATTVVLFCALSARLYARMQVHILGADYSISTLAVAKSTFKYHWTGSSGEPSQGEKKYGSSHNTSVLVWNQPVKNRGHRMPENMQTDMCHVLELL